MVSRLVLALHDMPLEGMGDGNSEDGAGEGTGEERKTSVSVREQTQKFNKLASESQLPSSSSRASSKSNRSSRSDKDDDDSTSILSYGPEGQEWQIAVAKSDFSEMLRLLKIHPSLARHKRGDDSGAGGVVAVVVVVVVVLVGGERRY
ncbi:hypothetical protein O3P69_007477 [Scylla paramamosain]|uniref:Uncharacterized protein n=1 Tax=Scylla paramamosain TaxID=85552 RepID=A0AAW0V6H7_SCYPA